MQPFTPSPSRDANERMAHALEYIASTLSTLTAQGQPQSPAQEMQPAYRPQGPNHNAPPIMLSATDRPTSGQWHS